MVSCSCDQMEVWSGSQKKDVARSNGMVQAQGICGSGAVWALLPAGCSEVSKPRLLAHAHGDTRLEG